MEPKRKQSPILISEGLRLQIDARRSDKDDTIASPSNAAAGQTLTPVTVKVKVVPDKHKSRSKMYPFAAKKNSNQKLSQNQKPKHAQKEFKVNDSSRTLLSFGMLIKKEYKSKKRPENKRKFLGNSKSGGCLDPPYDEDVYEYTIQTNVEEYGNDSIPDASSKNVTEDKKKYLSLNQTSDTAIQDERPESQLLLPASQNPINNSDVKESIPGTSPKIVTEDKKRYLFLDQTPNIAIRDKRSESQLLLPAIQNPIINSDDKESIPGTSPKIVTEDKKRYLFLDQIPNIAIRDKRSESQLLLPASRNPIINSDVKESIPGTSPNFFTEDKKRYLFLDQTPNIPIRDKRSKSQLLFASQDPINHSDYNEKTLMKTSMEYRPKGSKENMNDSINIYHKTQSNEDLTQPLTNSCDTKVMPNETLKYKQSTDKQSSAEKYHAASKDGVVETINQQILATSQFEIPNRIIPSQVSSNMAEIIAPKDYTTSQRSIPIKPLLGVEKVQHKTDKKHSEQTFSQRYVDNTVHLIPEAIESEKSLDRTSKLNIETESKHQNLYLRSSNPYVSTFEPSVSSVHVPDKEDTQQYDDVSQSAFRKSTLSELEGGHKDGYRALQKKNASSHSLSENNKIDLLDPSLTSTQTNGNNNKSFNSADISVNDEMQSDLGEAGNVNIIPINVDDTHNLQQHPKIGSFSVNQSNQLKNNEAESESPSKTNKNYSSIAYPYNNSTETNGNNYESSHFASNIQVTDSESRFPKKNNKLFEKKTNSYDIDIVSTSEDNVDIGTLLDRVYKTTNDEVPKMKHKSNYSSHVDNRQSTVKVTDGNIGSIVGKHTDDTIFKLPMIAKDLPDLGERVDQSKNSHKLTKINQQPSDITRNFMLGLKQLEKSIDKLENCIALQRSMLNNSSATHNMEHEKQLHKQKPCSTSQENIPIWKTHDDIARGTRHFGEGYLFPVDERTDAFFAFIKSQMNPIDASIIDENVKIAVKRAFSYMHSRKHNNLSSNIPKSTTSEIFKSPICKHEGACYKCGIPTTSKPDQNNQQVIRPACLCRHKLNHPHTSVLQNTQKDSICLKTDQIYQQGTKKLPPTTCQDLKIIPGPCKATRLGVTVEMYMDGKKTRNKLLAGGKPLQFRNSGNVLTLSISKNENKTSRSNNIIISMNFESCVSALAPSKQVMTL